MSLLLARWRNGHYRRFTDDSDVSYLLSCKPCTNYTTQLSTNTDQQLHNTYSLHTAAETGF